MQDSDFESEEITRTIPGLANAIATGQASALVHDDANDNQAHIVWSAAAIARKANRV